MSRPTFTAAALVLVLSVAACASSGSRDGEPVRYGRTAISLEEVRGAEAGNAFDIVRRTRPNWLSATPPRELIAVFVNDVQFGWVESLRQISSPAISTIEFMDRGDINARFTSEKARHISSGIRIRTR